LKKEIIRLDQEVNEELQELRTIKQTWYNVYDLLKLTREAHDIKKLIREYIFKCKKFSQVNSLVKLKKAIENGGKYLLTEDEINQVEILEKKLEEKGFSFMSLEEGIKFVINKRNAIAHPNFGPFEAIY